MKDSSTVLLGCHPPNADSTSGDLIRPSLRAVTEIVCLLRSRRQRLVLAESCTAGLIAATFSRLPGVSDVLAGSAVVYQLETKTAWLGVDPGILADPGPVSREVAEAMATGVLDSTPHASVALSITGHLGPGAPAELDGIAWCSIVTRGCVPTSRQLNLATQSVENRTVTASKGTELDSGVAIRHRRQYDAVRQAAELLEDYLKSRPEQATERPC